MSNIVFPEQAGGPPAREDVALVTCYFNPRGYDSRRKNFDIFKSHLGALAEKLWVVECGFPFKGYELDPGPRSLRVFSRHALWQKERLLNLAVSQMPSSIKKIVWLDCDILFENDEWLAETERQLDTHAVVQPFSHAVHLERGELASTATGQRSFASVYAVAPSHCHRRGYLEHGHTGFAWAARREVFTRVGLYELALSGFGDHLMAHAFTESIHSPCLDHLLGPASGSFRRHFMRWAAASVDLSRSRVGVVPGRVFHLWHGAIENRRYYLRALQFQRFDFDPERDVTVTVDGTLEWSSDKPELHQWAANCFGWRREDGEGSPPCRSHYSP